MRRFAWLLFGCVACASTPAPPPVRPAVDLDAARVAEFDHLSARWPTPRAIEACAEVAGMARGHVPIASRVREALWDAFARYREIDARSAELSSALYTAVLEVRDPSWGPRAMALLERPKTADDMLDPPEARREIAVRLVGALQYEPAVPAIVRMLFEEEDATGGRYANDPLPYEALWRMPARAEDELIRSLDGEEAPNAVMALAEIGRPRGRDAVVAWSASRHDAPGVVAALALERFPPTPETERAFVDATANLTAFPTLPSGVLKLPPGMKWLLLGEPRLLADVRRFADPELLDWVLARLAHARSREAQVWALFSAIALMPPGKGDPIKLAIDSRRWLLTSTGDAAELDAAFAGASDALAACDTRAQCYLDLVDRPRAVDDAVAKARAAKACTMAVAYGRADADATRARLVAHVERANDLLCLEDIDALAPRGDAHAADVIERVAAKTEGPFASTATRVVLRLRARAEP